jgi:hypothetical protein
MKVLLCQPPAKGDQRGVKIVVIERLVRGWTASDRGCELERRVQEGSQNGGRMIGPTIGIRHSV